jgi:hypothetical protein
VIRARAMLGLLALLGATAVTLSLEGAPAQAAGALAVVEGQTLDIRAAKLDVDVDKGTATLEGDVSAKMGDLSALPNRHQVRSSARVRWARVRRREGSREGIEATSNVVVVDLQTRVSCRERAADAVAAGLKPIAPASISRRTGDAPRGQGFDSVSLRALTASDDRTRSAVGCRVSARASVRQILRDVDPRRARMRRGVLGPAVRKNTLFRVSSANSRARARAALQSRRHSRATLASSATQARLRRRRRACSSIWAWPRTFVASRAQRA